MSVASPHVSNLLISACWLCSLYFKKHVLTFDQCASLSGVEDHAGITAEVILLLLLVEFSIYASSQYQQAVLRAST